MASEAQEDAVQGQKMGPITREEDAEEWGKRAEEIFKGLPSPPIPQLPREHAFNLSKYQNKPKLTPAEAVQKCADAMEQYDADECKAYREEIDTLLVFAGLFSAVVTAFTVESYQWLQDDPNDAIVALLSQIAQPGNQTRATAMQTGLPDAVSFRINAYWFSSLALALSAALVSIMCKQWVREFERHTGLSDAAQFIGIRQMKLQGFESWRVAGIVAAIPLLLQCALGLFALGLIELLWNLHTIVAVAVLIPATAALVFYALTTLLPAVQAVCSPFRILRSLPQCPFKSAQAMLALRVVYLLRCMVHWCSGVPETLSACIFYAWECIYRKCLVSWRRMRACWNPESFWPNGSRPHSLRRRVASIWHSGESQFFTPYDGVPRLPSVRPTLSKIWSFISSRRVLGGDQQEPHRSMNHPSSDSAPDFPTIKDIDSWLAVDKAFTLFRDRAYTSDEYSEAARRPVAGSIPAGYYFSALAWLRDYVHRPDIESWIFMSTWHILLAAQQGILSFPHEEDRMLHEIRSILPRRIDRQNLHEVSKPISLVFLFAQHAELDAAFISEIFVHNLSSLECDFETAELMRIGLTLGTEWMSLSSRVYAILALAMDSMKRQHMDTLRSGVGGLIRLAFTAVYNHPDSATDPALAVLVALYIRDARFAGRSVYEDAAMEMLLLAAVERLSADPGPESRNAATMAIFADVARIVCRSYERLERLQTTSWRASAAPTAAQLVAPCNRCAYIDLLIDALGSRGDAEAHFERMVGVAHWFSEGGNRVYSTAEPF